MNYRVTHTTTYVYEDLVSVCHNELRLTPRSGRNQTARRTQLLVDPAPAVLSSHLDVFGNVVSFVAVQEPHQRLVVTAKSDVEVTARATPDADHVPPWEQVRDRIRADRTAEGLSAYQFVFPSPHVSWSEELVDWTRLSFTPGRSMLDAVLDLVHRVHTDFAYDPHATTVSTPVGEVFAARRGVCQDFAHLAIACVRAMGVPARYVSGYILTTPPEGQERLVGADASHAWLGVHVPGGGWIDVDPTNDCIAGEQHVTLAWGRDYGDVAPLRGVVLGGGTHTMQVAVDVVPAPERAG